MLKSKTVKIIGQEAAIATGNMVVVEDELGNPLVVVVRTSERMNLILTAKDDDFNQMLHNLGLNKVVVNDTMHLAGPPEGARRLDVTQLSGFINGS